MNNLLDQLHAALLSRNAAEIIRIAEQIDWEYRGGKIVELPARINQTLFWNCRTITHEICVRRINFFGDGIFSMACTVDGWNKSRTLITREIGKTIFYTRRAADQALKEREKNG